MFTPNFEMGWVGSMDFELEDHVYSKIRDKMSWVDEFRVRGPYLLHKSR